MEQIQNVVVLMLENRSFDNMLGNLYTQEDGERNNINFVISGTKRANYDHEEVFYGATHFKSQLRENKLEKLLDLCELGCKNAKFPLFGPGEHIYHVARQLYNKEFTKDLWEDQGDLLNRIIGTTNDYSSRKYAIVENHRDKMGSELEIDIDDERILSMFASDFLPVLNGLAKNFAVCDYWFSSVPSQTWPNRCFLHSGESNNILINEGAKETYNAMKKLLKLPKSLFSVLNEEKSLKSQVIKSNSFGPSLTASFHFFDKIKVNSLKDFKKQCKKDDLPAYTFIEPRFWSSNEGQQNDQHPIGNGFGLNDAQSIFNDLSVHNGEELILEIYKALFIRPDDEDPKKSDSIVKKRLLIILYDENGGNFDHIFPPRANPPSNKNNNNNGKSNIHESFQFNRLGVRVPAVFVSPLIQPNTVLRSENRAVGFDHTSMIKSVISRFRPKYSGFSQNARINSAPEFWNIITDDLHYNSAHLKALGKSMDERLSLLLPNDSKNIDNNSLTSKISQRASDIFTLATSLTKLVPFPKSKMENIIPTKLMMAEMPLKVGSNLPNHQMIELSQQQGHDLSEDDFQKIYNDFSTSQNINELLAKYEMINNDPLDSEPLLKKLKVEE